MNGHLLRGVRCMDKKELLVSVIDDDESMRESLPDLLNEFGVAAHVFASALEFLASNDVGQTNCLILDISMPGMSGPQLKRELGRRRLMTPVIFITGNRNEVLRSRMIDDGAVECLFKPFSDTALLQALSKALSHR